MLVMIPIAEIGLMGSFGPLFNLLRRSDISFDKEQHIN